MPLDNSHNDAIIAGQIIAAHHALCTGLYSPVMIQLSDLLKRCLKDHFVINSDLSLEELNCTVNAALHVTESFQVFEVDYSKFDKSQETVCLDIFTIFMTRCGVPEPIVTSWKECHQVTWLKNYHFGISIETIGQQKSGDASTFIGNTIVTMASLASAYDLSHALCGAFGCDDSLVLFPEAFDLTDQSMRIMRMFNLVAKIEIYSNSIYFSSKFLIYADFEQINVVMS